MDGLLRLPVGTSRSAEAAEEEGRERTSTVVALRSAGRAGGAREVAPEGHLALARSLFETQARAIGALGQRLDGNFDAAVRLLAGAVGRVVTCGIGKSGLVARKIASTLSSTGTPALFLHPAEALHGDLGMVRSEDLLLLVSKSGETRELLELMPYLRGHGVRTVGLVGASGSSLWNLVDVSVDVSVERELCPHDLAPTTSTLAALAMGDALAVAVMTARGFQREDFARLHPGGDLGQRLRSHVRDVMRRESLPILSPRLSVAEALLVITNGKLGLGIVLSDARELVGVVTDGDLRRGMQRFADVLQRPVSEIMCTQPITVSQDALVVDAERRMRRLEVKALIVVQGGSQVTGVLQIFDQ